MDGITLLSLVRGERLYVVAECELFPLHVIDWVRESVLLFQTGAMSAGETFVWNDKFTFMGAEPTDFGSNGIDDTDGSKQNAIADQGTTTVSKLRMTKSASGDDWHINVSFIDQNNS